MTNEEKMRVAIEVAKESLKNGELPVGAATSFYIREIFYAHESPIDGAVKFAEEYWRPLQYSFVPLN